MLLDQVPRLASSAPPPAPLRPARTRRVERLLALGGLALVAAHAVDGAFVDLRPGASIASHLPWAAAVLGLVAAAAVFGARWPRGVLHRASAVSMPRSAHGGSARTW